MVDTGYRCPECGSNQTIGNGTKITRHGEFARRQCKICGRTFYADENKVEDK